MCQMIESVGKMSTGPRVTPSPLACGSEHMAVRLYSAYTLLSGAVRTALPRLSSAQPCEVPWRLEPAWQPLGLSVCCWNCGPTASQQHLSGPARRRRAGRPSSSSWRKHASSPRRRPPQTGRSCVCSVSHPRTREPVPCRLATISNTVKSRVKECPPSRSQTPDNAAPPAAPPSL